MTLLTEPTRIVLAKGQPVPNDPSFAFNSLLLHGDGTNGSTTITDSSGSPKTVTAVGDAQISTAQSKFGGASLASNGAAGSWVAVNGGGPVGLENFTIELWIYAFTSGGVIVDFRPLSTNGPYPTIYFQSGGLLSYYTAGSARITGAAFGLNLWRHVALVRNLGETRLYLDGNQTGSTYADSNSYINPALRPRLFTVSDSDNTPGFNGYIDDLRITKGVARYTANFTPPTAPFPDF